MIVSGCAYLIRNIDPYIDAYFWYKEKYFDYLMDDEIGMYTDLMTVLGMIVGTVLFIKVKVNIKCLIFLALILQILGLYISLAVHNYAHSNIAWVFLFVFGSGMNMMLCL